MIGILIMGMDINVIATELHTADMLRPYMRSLQTSVDLDSLLEQIGDARIVMLGEASHGTHEYYTWRSVISQRLIHEKRFNFIAVEGDWPDCYKLNRYIKNYSDAGASAFDVLHAFNRWPTWMWANWEMVAFAEWLYEYNKSVPVERKRGFYGLDVYSLWESMNAIIDYLKKVDPEALTVAKKAFQCFEPYIREEGTDYAYASLIVPNVCTKEVVDLLTVVLRKGNQYNTDHENVFSAAQNAYVAYNAEKYYRAMLRGGPHTWNIRDEHMMDTLTRLLDHHGPQSKVIVWAHNTHIGDARATDMVRQGMHNLGELARQKFGFKDVFLIGFGSYHGSVIGASQWGEAMEYMNVPEAIDESWEAILNKTNFQNAYLTMSSLRHDGLLDQRVNHRAIGVVYNEESERWNNYVPSILPQRYDAFIFCRQTKALHPLHIKPDGHQIPETYPFGV